jgi:pyrroline-5-carboxylate reductase
VDYPDLIQIAQSNEEVIEKADIIFIGLLPSVARSLLPTLPFTARHRILSMMAAVDYHEVVSLCRQNSETGPIVKIIPLPSSANRSGPILFFPPQPFLESIMSIVGTPVPCTDETHMKPLIGVTGQISPFYELLQVTQQWLESKGLPAASSRLYVAAFYSSLATAAFETTKDFSSNYFSFSSIVCY